MNAEPTWARVDGYFSGKLLAPDPALASALAASEAAALPAISVTDVQGKLLMLLALAAQARSVLEIGTLGGYSTIWLARALPAGGRLITLEADPNHAAVARSNIARAGFASVVEVRLGPAQDTLPRLAAEGAGPFDFIFIDADKPGYPEYLRAALGLSRSGTLIVADNVVRQGAVANPQSTDPSVIGVQAFTDAVAAERRLDATAIQTVGSKGYDGFLVARVR